MLCGYVSDEDDVALPAVDVVLERQDGLVVAARSTATGAIHAECESGDYRVTLAREGYVAKRVDVALPTAAPYRFRLLSERLAIYPWPKWCRAGDRVVAHVHSAEEYRLSVWRYGQSKELVGDLGWFGEHGPRALLQTTPDGDYSQVGVQWGRAGYDAPLSAFTAPPSGGLLYVHVETPSAAFASSPLVVAPRAPSSDLAVLASSNTWNAYNEFGGRSNYLSASGLPTRPTVNPRQDLAKFVRPGEYVEWEPPDDAYPPLAFARPDPANHIDQNSQVGDRIPGFISSSMAAVEWRLYAWLERQGFAYDLYADAQLHDGILDLSRYRALVIAGHPEYWSWRMFTSVHDWVERGGRLMSLGGNAIDCEVEFVEDDRLRFRTHVDMRGRIADQDDPTSLAHPFESRFHRSTGASGASLLGSVLTLPGFGTAAPYRVEQADHWVFADAGLRRGELFGSRGMVERCAAASGWETDKRRPSTPPGTVVLARGMNPDGGGAEMLYRDTADGGAVFSVGSITYCGSLLVDNSVSAVTRTVLTRFLRD